jgi:hypothetical protein
METEFWGNVRVLLARRTQQWLAQESGVGRTAINNGLGKDVKKKKSFPTADRAYKIAVTLGSTVEYLVGGEEGADYIKRWARENGGAWEPPSRIADIVHGLLLLTDEELVPIRGAVFALAGTKKREEAG